MLSFTSKPKNSIKNISATNNSMEITDSEYYSSKFTRRAGTISLFNVQMKKHMPEPEIRI